MILVRQRAIWLFLVIVVFYAAWNTGFTFTFDECQMFPNYSMLAKGFAKGHLYISQAPAADTVVHGGKQYLFSGPLPALVRLPVVFLFGCGVPTGLMIAIFCAAAGTFFLLTLDELLPTGNARQHVITKFIFFLVFVINGISLHMVTIPTLHHESITAAMCFLMLAIYLLARLLKRGFRLTTGCAVLLGFSLSASVASRFSYVYAAAAAGCICVYGVFRLTDSTYRQTARRSLLILIGIGLLAFGALLWYNYLRFGEILDFGMAYIDTMYSGYFEQGGYFRYEHLPYNVWSFLFRLPQFSQVFPFIHLPAYLTQVQSLPLPAGVKTDVLLNANELVVSVFFLMPLLLFAPVPLFVTDTREGRSTQTVYLLLLVLLCLQALPFMFTIAAIARYYYDFLPIGMLMACIGAIRVQDWKAIGNGTVVIIGGISMLLSWALPLNAIQFYAQFIRCRSPLLDIFF